MVKVKDVALVGILRAEFFAQEVGTERLRFRVAHQNGDLVAMREALAYAIEGLATARAWKRLANAHAGKDEQEGVEKIGRMLAEAQAHVSAMRRILSRLGRKEVV